MQIAGQLPENAPMGNGREMALSMSDYEESRNMNVRPLGDKLIVKREEASEMTDSGIYLPESAKDQPKQGKVMALGSGNLNRETGEYIPFTVKKGDMVIFSSYSGTEVKINDHDYLIMTEDDILGIID
jgi:chaperonin GroES